MDTRSITLTNLNSGEVFPTDLKLANTKFLQRGHKMYNQGIDYLLDRFTNTEIKLAISIFDSKYIDYHNLLICKFSQILPNMDPSHRSKLKRKLINNQVLQEHNKKLMLNPYIFIPRGDKNIVNSQNLTQRVWKYLFEDMNTGTEEVIAHAEHMFGTSKQSNYIHIGKGEFSTILEKPCK